MCSQALPPLFKAPFLPNTQGTRPQPQASVLLQHTSPRWTSALSCPKLSVTSSCVHETRLPAYKAARCGSCACVIGATARGAPAVTGRGLRESQEARIRTAQHSQKRSGEKQMQHSLPPERQGKARAVQRTGAIALQSWQGEMCPSSKGTNGQTTAVEFFFYQFTLSFLFSFDYWESAEDTKARLMLVSLPHKQRWARTPPDSDAPA